MRKLLSMLLVLTLVLSCVPVAAAAEQETLPAETVAQTVPAETEAEPTETEIPVETEAELAETEATVETEAVPAETEAQLAEVSFLCNPQDLELHVYAEQSGEEMLPSSGRTYLLEPGFYYMSASCQGYEDLTQAIFEVEQEDLQIPVELKVLEQPAETVPQETEAVQSQDDVTADTPALDAEGQIPIDEAHFPDPVFREFIRLNRDANVDHMLSKAERITMQSLEGNNRGFTSLKGIEWFPELLYLECIDNQLTELDLSMNKKLKTIRCGSNQLTELDLSSCPQVTQLYCDCNDIADLNVSTCADLQVLNCESNNLQFLDLTGTPRVWKFYGGANPFYAIKMLPDADPSTTNFYCEAVELRIPGGQLDLSTLPGLEMEKLVYNGSEGDSVYDNGIVNPYGEYEVNFSYTYHCSKYFTVKCTLHITDSDAKPVPLDETHFPDPVFRKFLAMYDRGDDGFLSPAECGRITDITLEESGVKSLKGIEYFTKLGKLECGRNQLTELDLSRNLHLRQLNCESNQLTELDFSRHKDLAYIYCAGNQLKTLDLSQSHYIWQLDCSGNQLTSMLLNDKDAQISLNASRNSYECSTPSATLDLRTLPGFDLSRASNFVGGKVLDGILIPDRPGRTVTYTYQCGTRTPVEFEIRVNKLRVPRFQIAGTNMTLGNSLTMHFYVNKADIRADCSYYAEITRSYADGRPDDVRQIPQSQWKSFGSTLYQFSYQGLAAKEMTDLLRVRICYTNGEQASEEKWDSIQDYCSRNIDKQSPMVRTMMVDMLNYGAAAQQQFHYGADYLANNCLTAEQRSWGTASVPMENKQVKGQNYAGCTLKLESRIMMDLYFLNVTEDQYAVLSFRDHTGGLHEKNVPYSAMKANGKYHLVTVDEMVLADCGQLVSCKLYNGQGQEVASAVDSPESYCARMGSLGGLFDTIMKFSASAHYYLHNR